jgi:hypothetical protein
MKNSFSIPFIDQKLSFWEEIQTRFGSFINEVYLPIDNEITGSGRPIQSRTNLSEFLESGVLPLGILINPIVLHKEAEKIGNPILKELEIYIKKYNIKSVTVTNLTLAGMIRKNLPELSLTASTLVDISNTYQITMLNNLFDCIVPSNKLIRDLKGLKNLKSAFKGKIRLLVNESCLPYCVYRTQHFFEMSTPSFTYPLSLCNSLLKENSWLKLTGSWILPQHLNFFEEIFDEIKLAGRVTLQNPEKYISVLDGYIHRRLFKPNQIGGGPASIDIDIPIEDDFYEYTLSCSKNCTSCSICSEYWKIKTGQR